MAQDPGRVFPGKRMAGHLGNERARAEPEVVRVDTERSCCWSGAAVPGLPTAVDVVVRPSVQAPRPKKGADNGTQAASTTKAKTPRTTSALRTRCSAATTTKRWCTRSSSRIRPTRARARARRRTAATSTIDTRSRGAQKGTGRARAGMASSPLWRGGGQIFPNSPDENFSHKVNRKMYRAGMASILSQLAREDRLAVVEALARRLAEDQAVRRRRSRRMGLPYGAGHHRQARREPVPVRRATCPTCWCSSRAMPTRCQPGPLSRTCS